MKILGIICELNPAHNGHQYLVEEAKKQTNCDFAVAIMSGNFVQRGTPAIFDYQTRAQMALNVGFDAVIYMPTAYSINSADDFAKYGTLVAKLLNIDYLAFGVTKNKNELERLLTILLCEDERFKELLANNLENGISYATALTQALEQVSDIANITGNDILALQYMKNLNDGIAPCPILRVDSFSATKLRELILNNDYVATKNYVNDKNYKLICETKPLNFQNYETLLYCNLITKNKDKIKNTKSIKEGLENRIINALDITTNFKEFNAEVKNKRYTQSFLNRLYANILLDINKDISLELPYLKIVAIKSDEVLKNLKSQLPIITNLKDKSLLDSKSLYSTDQIACRIYNALIAKSQPPFPYHKMIIY